MIMIMDLTQKRTTMDQMEVLELKKEVTMNLLKSKILSTKRMILGLKIQSMPLNCESYKSCSGLILCVIYG
jgi:hypothetical protein